jgi:predicted amidohydrolase YtcJ
MEQAITAYTRNGAYFTREERLKGSLEPGKLADMIVLSRDLLTEDPSKIMDTQVEMTILGGRIVYSR